METPDMNLEEKKIPHLLNQLFINKDYITLRSFSERDTFFDILNQKQKETMHTSVLAWILDPHSSLGLGTIPIKLLLQYICLVDNKKILPIEFQDVIGDKILKVNELEFSIEKELDKNNRLDLFAANEELSIVIENKVEANEHDNQTQRYYNYLETEGRSERNVYIYLNIDISKKPSCQEFIHITYQELFEHVLKPIQANSNLPSRSKNFLDEYIQNLAKPTNNKLPMANPFITHCERIGSENERLFELLHNYRDSKMVRSLINEIDGQVINQVFAYLKLPLLSVKRTTTKRATLKEVFDGNFLFINDKLIYTVNRIDYYGKLIKESDRLYILSESTQKKYRSLSTFQKENASSKEANGWKFNNIRVVRDEGEIPLEEIRINYEKTIGHDLNLE